MTGERKRVPHHCLYDFRTLTSSFMLMSADGKRCMRFCSKWLLSALYSGQACIVSSELCMHFSLGHACFDTGSQTKQRLSVRAQLGQERDWGAFVWVYEWVKMSAVANGPEWQIQTGMTLAVNFRFGNCWPGLCPASVAGLFWHATSHSKSLCLQTV